MYIRTALLVLAYASSLCLSGCATSSARPANAAVANPLVISEEELDAANQENNAYEQIRRLRPGWFAVRGAVTFSLRRGAPGAMRLSVDGGALQALDLLTQMRPSEMKAVHFLDATEATQRFGTIAASSAVILVERR